MAAANVTLAKPPNMKILITGATGLIGKELISQLRAHNFDIHYLTLHESEIHNREHVHGFLWDPAQGRIDENCLIGVDKIIHLAGAPISKRWTAAYQLEIIESRTLSAGLLYKTLKKNPHQVTQIVSASAIGIYANSLSETHTETSDSFDDSFLGNVVTKWENSVARFSQLGITVCTIRTGLVLSTNGGVLVELLKPTKAGFGSAFGSGGQWQSWIHISDIAAMYVAAIEGNWEGIFNGTAPNPVSNSELTSAIAKKGNKPYFMPKVPRLLMRILLGKMHILLFASQKVLPTRALAHDFRFKFTNLDDALNDLLA